MPNVCVLEKDEQIETVGTLCRKNLIRTEYYFSVDVCTSLRHLWPFSLYSDFLFKICVN